MASVNDRNQENRGARRRFDSESAASIVSGFSVRTLQKDRLFGRNRFPYYKVGRKVLYDLDEVEAIIRQNVRGGSLRPVA